MQLNGESIQFNSKLIDYGLDDGDDVVVIKQTYNPLQFVSVAFICLDNNNNNNSDRIPHIHSTLFPLASEF